jgi:hypothetical protein
MWNTSMPTSPYPLEVSVFVPVGGGGVFFVANRVDGRYP